jgi:hypothetical protein
LVFENKLAWIQKDKYFPLHAVRKISETREIQIQTSAQLHKLEDCSEVESLAHHEITNYLPTMDLKISPEEKQQRELDEAREEKYEKLRDKLLKQQASRERHAAIMEEQRAEEQRERMEAYVSNLSLERVLFALQVPAQERIVRDAEQKLEDMRSASVEHGDIIFYHTREGWNESDRTPYLPGGRISLRRMSYKKRLDVEAARRKVERQEMFKRKEGRGTSRRKM